MTRIWARKSLSYNHEKVSRGENKHEKIYNYLNVLMLLVIGFYYLEDLLLNWFDELNDWIIGFIGILWEKI